MLSYNLNRLVFTLLVLSHSPCVVFVSVNSISYPRLIIPEGWKTTQPGHLIALHVW